MPTNTQTNIGALFKNARRTTEKSPILTGILELDPDLVAHLCQKSWLNKPAKISLAAWKNTSKDGEAYFTLKAQKEYINGEVDAPDEEPNGALDL